MQRSAFSTHPVTPADGAPADITHDTCRGFQPAVWLALAVLILVSATSLAFDYGRSPNPMLRFDSSQAGQSPAHRLSITVGMGELETYRAVVTYPDGFRFNGFNVLGPVNTPVGAYELDLNFDGTPERTVPLRSLTPHSAYADVIPDNRFNPDLEPVLTQVGRAGFVLLLPFGGDANPATRVAPFAARLSLVLFPGLLTNPDAGGVYTVSGALTSVDPDTDGADDGLGEPPLSVAVALDVRIEHVPFTDFRIDVANLKLQDGPYDHFMVQGRYRLDAASDGVDLPNETVTVTFDTFSQRIPGRLFSPTVDGFQFTDKGPGIKQLKLGTDGRFQIDARDLVLESVDLSRPVAFVLQVGDDRGETTISFDRHGHCGPEPGARRCTP